MSKETKKSKKPIAKLTKVARKKKVVEEAKKPKKPTPKIPKKKPTPWNPGKQREKYRAQEKHNHSRTEECLYKIDQGSRSHERQYDQALAREYVLGSLCESASVDSREELLADLQDKLSRPDTVPGAFDNEVCEAERKRWLKRLISETEKEMAMRKK